MHLDEPNKWGNILKTVSNCLQSLRSSSTYGRKKSQGAGIFENLPTKNTHFITAAIWVQSRDTPRGICGRLSGKWGRYVSRRFSYFPRSYHAINASHPSVIVITASTTAPIRPPQQGTRSHSTVGSSRTMTGHNAWTTTDSVDRSPTSRKSGFTVNWSVISWNKLHRAAQNTLDVRYLTCRSNAKWLCNILYS